jgi:vacuolar-type H+-ATPase subunit H
MDWEYLLSWTFFLGSLALIACIIVAIILKVRKKNSKPWWIACAILLAISLVSLIVGVSIELRNERREAQNFVRVNDTIVKPLKNGTYKINIKTKNNAIVTIKDSNGVNRMDKQKATDGKMQITGSFIDEHMTIVSNYNGSVAKVGVTLVKTKAQRKAESESKAKEKSESLAESQSESKANSISESKEESESKAESVSKATSRRISESKAKAAEAKKYDPSNYQSIAYDQLARNPDDYEHKKIQFSGQVMQVQNDDDATLLLVWENDNSDNLIMVYVDSGDMPKNGNILEDDEVTVYGIGNGTKSYDTAIGSKNEVPLVMTDRTVVDNGKSSNAY